MSPELQIAALLFFIVGAGLGIYGTLAVGATGAGIVVLGLAFTFMGWLALTPGRDS